ncbi:MAG: HAD family hydrolase [Rhodospirillales bacterium]
MFLLHVALQGCLRGADVEYGVTADTGGHIRYLLGLVQACERRVERIVIATRAFKSDFGPDYARPYEPLSDKIAILRIPTPEPGYLAKEALWHEVPALAEGLIAWIEAQDRRPDVLHAHYADAGVVAAQVRARLGIPFVFTGHSLGRVKRQAFAKDPSQDNPDRPGDSERRIASEERALETAALVIASSRDEAEQQYATYRAYDPGRIRVVPPGADLAVFASAKSSPEVVRAIERFLNRPEKPLLLAIARPVVKKNLASLVAAYGQSPALRARANLVMIAGNREDIAALETESAGCLREILELIDRYDLYGQVAYPKTHAPDDIPAIYAYARERRGIFVNPALNEPFGLTLLEAAAAGLPIVATENGGPNDIVEICRNGLLVDPQDLDAIASAALTLLDDRALWDRYSAAGAQAVGRFNWESHAERYLGLLRALLAGPAADLADPRELLVCDVDNTLVGAPEAAEAFGAWRAAQSGLAFAVATGRSFHSALSVLEQERLPLPDSLITSVGAEIYHRSARGPAYRADPDWAAVIDRDWDREAIRRLLEDLPGLRPQADLEQRHYKLSYLTGNRPDLPERVRETLRRAGLACNTIFSHGRYLDVLPAFASKGTALDHLRRYYDLAEDAVFAAGDSGNDRQMLSAAAQGIIVANHCDGIAGLPDLAHCHVTESPFAWGVMEGVAHFRKAAGPAGSHGKSRAGKTAYDDSRQSTEPRAT